VATGRSDFESALGAFLAFDIARSSSGPLASRIFGCGRDKTCVPLK
jgi:hypothetical protein